MLHTKTLLVVPKATQYNISILDPTLIGEENETFFIRVWKPLIAEAF